MKNKTAILLLVSLFFLVQHFACAVNDVVSEVQEIPSIEEISDKTDIQIQTEDAFSDAEPIKPPRQSIQYKDPISKRSLIKKFLLAMFAVAGSSVILYAGLTFYNRFRRDEEDLVVAPDNEGLLTTPNDYETAIKTFLKKTKW